MLKQRNSSEEFILVLTLMEGENDSLENFSSWPCAWNFLWKIFNYNGDSSMD